MLLVADNSIVVISNRPDVKFFCDLSYDPFKYMQEHDKVYSAYASHSLLTATYFIATYFVPTTAYCLLFSRPSFPRGAA